MKLLANHAVVASHAMAEPMEENKDEQDEEVDMG